MVISDFPPSVQPTMNRVARPEPVERTGALPARSDSAAPGRLGSTGTKSHAFASVFALLAPHVAELDRFLHGQIAAFEPEIRAMADYCIDTSGKRIRPALVFLSGWQGPGVVAPDLVRV